MDWRDKPLSGDQGAKYILKVGYVGLDSLALELVERTIKPFGLVSPFENHNLQYTFSCMAMVRDHFPQFHVYAPVPAWCPREFIRSAKGAGFNSFIFPWMDPWSSTHQVVHDLVEGKRVHVAGGDPGVKGWTWSEEKLG